MRYATYLLQLPQGLVSIAVSFAVLPTLSAHAVRERDKGTHSESFTATLAQGLRLVSVLIIPATVGLFILAHPVVALLFEHGAFTTADTVMTSRALQLYLLGLPFAAVDLLLVVSFYARQDTLTPSLIGVATVLIYLVTVIVLVPMLGLFSLMVGESLKLLLHTAISAVILQRRVGGLGRHGVIRAIGLALIAAAAMGLASYGALQAVEMLVPPGGLQEVLAVGVPGVIGAAIYVGLVTVFRVEEMHQLIAAVRQRLARS
jgi:putative peptidoglycan lipid II flippase